MNLKQHVDCLGYAVFSGFWIHPLPWFALAEAFPVVKPFLYPLLFLEAALIAGTGLALTGGRPWARPIAIFVLGFSALRWGMFFLNKSSTSWEPGAPHLLGDPLLWLATLLSIIPLIYLFHPRVAEYFQADAYQARQEEKVRERARIDHFFKTYETQYQPRKKPRRPLPVSVILQETRLLGIYTCLVLPGFGVALAHIPLEAVLGFGASLALCVGLLQGIAGVVCGIGLFMMRKWGWHGCIGSWVFLLIIIMLSCLFVLIPGIDAWHPFRAIGLGVAATLFGIPPLLGLVRPEVTTYFRENLSQEEVTEVDRLAEKEP